MVQSVSHALSIQGLTKRYGSLAAVDNVSLEIPQGAFLTLLGPSGSGKTTILMSIAGFVDPSEGHILLDGQDITRLPPDKRNFGMVFQGYALFPHMTVGDNIWFPLKVRGIAKSSAKQKIADALELVQMGHLAERFPSQLSGGQQQRVALARALVFEPDLLLLDEPLSALDKKLRADLQWELKSLHNRLGTTFIYVTHDQEEALSMSDEIVILRDGRIEQQGDPGKLYEQPATRFVADFLGKSNFLSGQVVAKDSQDFSYGIDGQVFRQSGTTERAQGEALLLALRPEKIEIATDKPDLANAVQGRIAAFNYYGSSFHFQVETHGLGEMIVTSAAWTCEVDPAVGTEVWLGWQPDASVVVHEG
ncbi:MAG: polyamine ABC transporter ATP-binding protein [Rhodospirillales bacterium]